MRFLVLENDEDQAELLCQLLRDLDHGVCGIARSARQARTLIALSRPKALLVDVAMSGAIAVARESYQRDGIRSLFVGGIEDEVLIRGLQPIQPYGFIARPMPVPDPPASTGEAD
ncbi:response regulator [Arenibaculum pallidiluteum]|uniref:hypothetical protein n=1 Tax=Arenibaculum pallidiluteum TaxID=2812559 RepID=UPI001A962A38|nr:hypothetical protein [Arenibaculum pallidiluteum]